ncbi:MAG: substrate-binding domain-containing protein [Rhodobacteraceae bacterium]|nr:substrate-binding domain-containing protein [Paracoccaceae bacterium]
MKLNIPAFVAALAVLLSAAHAETVRLAVTTSFHNSGLSDTLLPAIQQELGIEVQLLVVGTGQALRLGRNGDVDALLVHSRDAEEQFVAEGFGVRRCELMYNDFVLIGPKDDPAGVAAAASAAAALSAIATFEKRFVSRGDDSGTHTRELHIWSLADLDPDEFGSWYSEVGAGMGASLNTASALNAYILSDRASWLAFGNKGALALLYSGDAELHNQYAFLQVSQARHSHVKAELASRVERWLSGPRGGELINGFRLQGESLFRHNASCNG